MDSGFRHVEDQVSSKILPRISHFWRLDTLDMANRHALDQFWGIDTHVQTENAIKWRLDTPSKINELLSPYLTANRHVLMGIEHTKVGNRHIVSDSLL